MPKSKIDINKIKEKEINKEEIQKNEKETNIKTWILYRIPIATEIILSLIYIPTSNHILLIPISLIFILVLYGIDCHQRICSYCKKWNSTVVINSENILKTTKVTKQNLIGKDKIKSKNNIINKTKSKCLNCGHEFDKETKRNIK